MTVTRSDSMYSRSVAGRASSRFPAVPWTSATCTVSVIYLFPSISHGDSLVKGGYGCRLFGFLLGLACPGGSDFAGDANFDAECFLMVRAGFLDDAVITRRHAPSLKQFLEGGLGVSPPQGIVRSGECTLDERLLHEPPGSIQSGIQINGCNDGFVRVRQYSGLQSPACLLFAPAET